MPGSSGTVPSRSISTSMTSTSVARRAPREPMRGSASEGGELGDLAVEFLARIGGVLHEHPLAELDLGDVVLVDLGAHAHGACRP